MDIASNFSIYEMERISSPGVPVFFQVYSILDTVLNILSNYRNIEKSITESRISNTDPISIFFLRVFFVG